MLLEFFYLLRQAGVPVSITEFLTLLEALKQHLAGFSVEDFYYLSRATLVKDERHFDRFDKVFEHYYRGLEAAFGEVFGEIPEDWLRKIAELHLSEEEKRQVEALGGWDKLMETLKKRLAEQQGRHQGGNKWIGTGGRSPFGHGGYNPEGVRIGGESRERRAVKVWEQRQFRNFSDTVELGTRNLKVALRKLRRFAREGAAEELDLDDTIRATARNAGLLDLKMVPERHNAVKVLLFLDAGGSMDEHVQVCEELFSAARAEFKHLEHYYFHNCVYESVWRDNQRRLSQRIPTWEVLHTYGADYKLVIVGDATMSPYEIEVPGGSVEHVNDESGRVWLSRLLASFPNAIWLNPQPEMRWGYIHSLQMIRELMEERMYPLTLEGLEQGIRELRQRR